MKAKLLIVLAVLALVFSLAGTAGANPSGLVNQSWAHTEQHHPDSQVLAWALAQTDRHAVTALNVARAFAHDCDGCTSEAVSFQVVLASGTNLYTLTNTATSINAECETCTAVSVAEQWVVGSTEGTVVLSEAGQAALEAVQAQLGTLVAQPPSEGLAGILEAADEVSAILASDVTVTVPPSQAAPLARATPVQVVPKIQHYASSQTYFG